eukprot:TRINITY_DN8971_c0_g1_i2.p1 TRINITY_DN8971_c0_g1~~TRINITY_DN8971_c0_g1_i2.p1  ORF type:complete len:101 (-),score=9.20 TRINITY_DN8971_c0_g1_i2:206-508(-)
MTKIDIKESGGRSNSAKSPSPARRDAGVAVTHNSETDRSAKKDIEQTKNSDKIEKEYPMNPDTSRMTMSRVLYKRRIASKLFLYKNSLEQQLGQQIWQIR